MTASSPASAWRNLFGFATKNVARSTIFLFGAMFLMMASCSGYGYLVIEQETAASSETLDRLDETVQAQLAPAVEAPVSVKENYLARKAEAQAAIGALRRHVALIALLTLTAILLGCVAAAYLVYRSAVQPLQWITFTFKQLVLGDTNYGIDEATREDEIGELGRVYSGFRQIALDRNKAAKVAEEQTALAEAERQKSESERATITATQNQIINALSTALAKIAKQDLTFYLTEDVPSAYESLKRDFNSAVENLRATIGAVAEGVDIFSSATNEIGSAADDLARRTEQQAASLEETTAALQEILVGVKKNAEGASHARNIVAAANAEAEKSSAIAQNTIDAISRIEKSSTAINQIISVIDEIAFQTNLLALNAGVEAARAGDAGKGFAVVASEVRNLAQRSAEAAKEIKQLISTSAGEVADGVRFVTETRDAMQRIVALVGEINQVITATAKAASEQSTAIHQVSIALQQMDQDTQKNAAMVEETTAATHSLRQEAKNVVLAVESFNIGKIAKSRAGASPVKAPATPKASGIKNNWRGGSAAAATALSPDPQANLDDWTDF
jgi:methyl-accepting chemotaxis protein